MISILRKVNGESSVVDEAPAEKRQYGALLLQLLSNTETNSSFEAWYSIMLEKWTEARLLLLFYYTSKPSIKYFTTLIKNDSSEDHIKRGQIEWSKRQKITILRCIRISSESRLCRAWNIKAQETVSYFISRFCYYRCKQLTLDFLECTQV